MSNRHSFDWRKIKKIIQKTEGRCFYCHCQLPNDTYVPDDGYAASYKIRNWHVDHVMPISRGGSNLIENLVPACCKCNAEKSNMTASEYMESK